MQQYTYAIKNARGQVCATVTCQTTRQAYANAGLVIRNLQTQQRGERVLDVFYAEPVAIQ